jgi:hypothetical protein
MKRQTSGIAVSLLFGLLMLTSGCKGDSNAATKPNFYCGNAQYLGKNAPATIVYNPSANKDFTIIIWKPDNYYFGNQWNPQKRCDQVSRRFQDIYDRDGLQYITATVASWISDREVSVVCGLKSNSATCNQDDLLFTLETKDEPYAVLDDLMKIRQEPEHNAALTRGVNDSKNSSKKQQVFYDLSEILKVEKSPTQQSKPNNGGAF